MKRKQRVVKKETGKDGGDSLREMISPMQEMIERNKQLYVERHDYRPATAADFKGRDRTWYDAASRELEGLGYRALGDVVNETVARSAGIVIVLRRMVSADGTTAAALYQFVQGSGKSKVDLRLCEFETELSDGTFLATSNAEASAGVSLPSQIRSMKLPADTTASELVALHEASKDKALRSQKDLRAVEVRTAEDYQAAQHRQEAIKAAFRQGIGYLDPAEIQRIVGQQAPDDPALAAVAAVSADVARQQDQLQRDDPMAAGLMAMLLGGGEASPTDLAKVAVDSMLQSHPNVPADQRDAIAATMTNLFNSASNDEQDGDGESPAGMKNLLTLMGQLQALEPEAEKEARREDFKKMMAKAAKDHERRQAAHVKKRLARGLSRSAGTGKPEPEILIHGLPVAELDYEDKPRGLGEMIQEIKASKARRDAKTLAGLPLGHSRIGGLPDLPPGQTWPTHKRKRIPFVAQLNLADFPKAQRPLLPERGFLYAFALISNDKKHRPAPVAVFLYEGDAASLVRAPYPADDEVWEDWRGERVYEILPATATPKGRDPKKRSNELGETLGWLQGEMEDYFGTPGEIADADLQDGNDWINLLAIQSDGSMQWSDCGHLYLLIRKSALKKRDFSNVLAAVCSS